MPTAVGEVYSSREEIELDLDKPSIEELKEKMQQKKIEVDLTEVLTTPLLNAVTQRRDLILEKMEYKYAFHLIILNTKIMR